MNKSQYELMRSFVNEYEKNAEKINYSLERDFETLRQYSIDLRLKKATIEGEREHNRRKNRYKDILPFDDSRVILKSLQNGENKEIGGDYINASKVDGALDDSYKYIAAQGPTRDTVPDFVRMLKDYRIKILICACNEFEGQKLKCHRYWTDSVQEPFCIYPNFYVELKTEPIIYEGCIERHLIVSYPKSALDGQSQSSSSSEGYAKLEFVQYHFTNWPDHGVPESCESIINILRLVRQNMIVNNRRESEARGKKVPLSSDYLAVHCSAGCGRTGTIIAIDQLWTLMDENKLTSDFSMYKIASKLREQRVAMIQTLLQYQLFGKAIYHLFTSKLQEIAATQSSPVNNQASSGYSARQDLKIHSSNPSKSVAPLAPFSPSSLIYHSSHSELLDRFITAAKKDVSPSASSHYDNEPTKTSDKQSYLNVSSMKPQLTSSPLDTNNNNIYSSSSASDPDPAGMSFSIVGGGGDGGDGEFTPNANPNDSSSSTSSASSTASSPKSSSTLAKQSKHGKLKQKGIIKGFLNFINPTTATTHQSTSGATRRAPALIVSSHQSLGAAGTQPAATNSPHSTSSTTSTSTSSISVSSKSVPAGKYKLTTTPSESANHSLNDANSRSADEPDDDDEDDDNDIIVHSESKSRRSDRSKHQRPSLTTTDQNKTIVCSNQPDILAQFPPVKNPASSAEDSEKEKSVRSNNVQVVRRKSRPQTNSDFLNRVDATAGLLNKNLEASLHGASKLLSIDASDGQAYSSVAEYVNASKSSKIDQFPIKITPQQSTPSMNNPMMTQSQTTATAPPPASSNYQQTKIYTIVNGPPVKSAITSIQSDATSKPTSRTLKVDQPEPQPASSSKQQQQQPAERPKLKQQASTTERSKFIQTSSKDDASEDNSNSDPPKPPSRPKNDRRKSSYTITNASSNLTTVTPVTTKVQQSKFGAAGNDSESDSLNSEDDDKHSKSSNDNNDQLSNSRKFTTSIIDATSPSIFSNLDKQPAATKSVALVDNNPNVHRSMLLSNENRKLRIIPNSELYRNNKLRGGVNSTMPGYEIKMANDENSTSSSSSSATATSNKMRPHQDQMDMMMSMPSESFPRKMSSNELNQDQVQMSMTQSQTSNPSSSSSTSTQA